MLELQREQSCDYQNKLTQLVKRKRMNPAKKRAQNANTKSQTNGMLDQLGEPPTNGHETRRWRDKLTYHAEREQSSKTPFYSSSQVYFKRLRADSNRCRRICNPLPSHSATKPFELQTTKLGLRVKGLGNFGELETFVNRSSVASIDYCSAFFCYDFSGLGDCRN